MLLGGLAPESFSNIALPIFIRSHFCYGAKAFDIFSNFAFIYKQKSGHFQFILLIAFESAEIKLFLTLSTVNNSEPDGVCILLKPLRRAAWVIIEVISSCHSNTNRSSQQALAWFNLLAWQRSTRLIYKCL